MLPVSKSLYAGHSAIDVTAENIIRLGVQAEVMGIQLRVDTNYYKKIVRYFWGEKKLASALASCRGKGTLRAVGSQPGEG